MTAKRKAGRPTRAIMDRKEWDFERIPADQLEACFCYEYGRELTKQWPRLLKLLSMVKARAALPGRHRDSSKENKTFRFTSQNILASIRSISNSVTKIPP